MLRSLKLSSRGPYGVIAYLSVYGAPSNNGDVSRPPLSPCEGIYYVDQIIRWGVLDH